MRVLLIWNDRDVAGDLKYELKKERHLTDIAFTARAGVEQALENIYQLILLDYDFAAGLGRRILMNIRSKGIHTPILIIGEKLTMSVMSDALKLGADDFLPKPFEVEMLMLRMKVMVKHQSNPIGYYQLGDVTFLPDQMTVKGVEGEVMLTSKEAALLELFILNRHQIVPKGLIEERIWNAGDDFSGNTIEVHISRLRKKLRHQTELLTIETVRKVGYRFEVVKDPLSLDRVDGQLTRIHHPQ